MPVLSRTAPASDPRSFAGLAAKHTLPVRVDPSTTAAATRSAPPNHWACINGPPTSGNRGVMNRLREPEHQPLVYSKSRRLRQRLVPVLVRYLHAQGIVARFQ